MPRPVCPNSRQPAADIDADGRATCTRCTRTIRTRGDGTLPLHRLRGTNLDQDHRDARRKPHQGTRHADDRHAQAPPAQVRRRPGRTS